MFTIINKKGKEWLRVNRMPGSKPGQVPWQNRDFSVSPIGGPWGNIKDFGKIVKSLNVSGLALFDPIDNPAEVEYVEFENERYISEEQQSITGGE